MKQREHASSNYWTVRIMSAAAVMSALTFAGEASAAAGSNDAGGITNKYRITAEEQSACALDAVQLCSDAYPDEDKLLGCMKLNRVNLSAMCKPIFEEGIRRRHLN